MCRGRVPGVTEVRSLSQANEQENTDVSKEVCVKCVPQVLLGIPGDKGNVGTVRVSKTQTYMIALASVTKRMIRSIHTNEPLGTADLGARRVHNVEKSAAIGHRLVVDVRVGISELDNLLLARDVS